MEKNEKEKTAWQLIPITAKDCINYPPVRYILDGIIEAGTITLVSGKEKIGKTYILMHLALCMAIGIPWLGIPTMQDDKGNVIWLDFDMNRNTTMRRINQITNGIEEAWDVRKPNLFKKFGMMDGQLFRDFGYTDSFQFYDPSNAVEALKEYIIANNVKVCFIDNLVQIEGRAEENSSNDIQQVFSGLKKLRDETHCAFIIIHHTTKDGYRGRGSSAIFGETDLNLQLDQSETDSKMVKLITDGSRNTANQEIGMCKEWQPRMGKDGKTSLTDDNGHPIFNFMLKPVNASDIVTKRDEKGNSQKALRLESNIKQITKWFEEHNNIGSTQTFIMKYCGLKGSNPERKDAVIEAFDRGLLVKEGVDYRLNTNKGDGKNENE